MRFTSKIISAALLASSSAFAGMHPELLTSYNSLVASLHSGEDVKAIIYLDGCHLKSGGPLPAHLSDAVGRINFNVFSDYNVMEEGKTRRAVATSFSMLTEHYAYGPVTAYARVRVFTDNSVEYHVSFYDPKTYEQKASTDFLCSINNGSVNLYTSRL
jgi:hypothetical protein